MFASKRITNTGENVYVNPGPALVLRTVIGTGGRRNDCWLLTGPPLLQEQSLPVTKQAGGL